MNNNNIQYKNSNNLGKKVYIRIKNVHQTRREHGDESVTYPFQCLSYRVQIIRQRYYVVIRGGNFKRAARGTSSSLFSYINHHVTADDISTNGI